MTVRTDLESPPGPLTPLGVGKPLAEDSKGSVSPTREVSRGQDDQEHIPGNSTGASGEDWSTRGDGGHPLNPISVKSTLSAV